MRPNPSRAEVVIVLEGSCDAVVTIHDVRGGIVRGAEPIRPGTKEWVWDGKDDTGRPVASGVYLVRVAGPEGAAVRRIVRLNAQN